MAIKAGAERISAKISSPMIVDQMEWQARGPFAIAKNYFKTRFILNQTESQFIDFNRRKFPLFAKDRYFNLTQAYKRKDKVDMMRLLSVPLYDIFKDSLKTKDPLPFQLYDEITDIKLIQARIYNKGKIGSNPQETWHQITLKFKYVDAQNKDVVKHNVFERRESDSSEKDWRICYIG